MLFMGESPWNGARFAWWFVGPLKADNPHGQGGLILPAMAVETHKGGNPMNALRHGHH